MKHQQIISGTSLIPFWLSTYFIDLIRTLPSIIVAIVCYLAFGVDIPWSWVLFILFMFAIHPFTYVTSHLFKKESVAQTLTIIFHIAVGGLFTIVILTLFSIKSTQDIGKVLRWVFKIIPSFALCYGIL